MHWEENTCTPFVVCTAWDGESWNWGHYFKDVVSAVKYFDEVTEPQPEPLNTKKYEVPLEISVSKKWTINARSKEEAIDIAQYMIRTMNKEDIMSGCELHDTTIIVCNIEEIEED